MKPRNKFQQKAVEASKKLPPLTPAQERWAYTKVIESVGQRIETVEVSLSQLKVIQSRGVCNKQTEYHDKIVQLVNDNMPLIQKRIAA